MKFLASLLLLLTTYPLAGETRIRIDGSASGPTIHKDVYGQFMEHLGRGIYEGIWVGEDSKIPNERGFRTDVLDALRELRIPVLRWPGGCFADEYHWRDGIGPRNQRPTTVNTTWGGVTENNAFGTHEFMNFAELVGADVYVNANLGTGSPREMAEWLEYMTATGNSSLASLRRANGREDPWRLHYFAIGNESWGCGGSMTPEYYGHLYKHWATFAKTPGDNQPTLIASGGNDDLTEWTETLMGLESSWSYRLEGIAHHYYTLPTGDWNKKGYATGFAEDEWFSTMRQTLRLEGFIEANLAIMDAHDPDKKVGFFVDEWGTWYDPPEGESPGILFQQNSLRDAVLAAVNLNMFHRYAERIRMTNIAQMVNVLQAMILTDGERMLRTPTFHVYAMHVPFQGATVLPAKVEAMPEYAFGDDSIDGLSVSAARAAGGEVYLSLVNLDPKRARKVEISGDRGFAGARGKLLTAEAMDAHNTFDDPNSVLPREIVLAAEDGDLSIELPAKSVLVVRLD